MGDNRGKRQELRPSRWIANRATFGTSEAHYRRVGRKVNLWLGLVENDPGLRACQSRQRNASSPQLQPNWSQEAECVPAIPSASAPIQRYQANRPIAEECAAPGVSVAQRDGPRPRALKWLGENQQPTKERMDICFSHERRRHYTSTYRETFDRSSGGSSRVVTWSTGPHEVRSSCHNCGPRNGDEVLSTATTCLVRRCEPLNIPPTRGATPAV